MGQEVQFSETMLQKGNTPERQGKVHMETKIAYRVSTTGEEIAVMIESVIIGILSIANASRKTSVKWEWIVPSSTRKRKSIHQASTKRERQKERVQSMKRNGCNREYKSPSKEYFRRALARHAFAQSETAVRKHKHEIPTSEFAKGNIHSGKNGRSTQWNEEHEQVARHKAHKIHEELFKTEGHKSDVHSTNFCRRHVSTKAKNTANDFATHPKEGCELSTVALRHM